MSSSVSSHCGWKQKSGPQSRKSPRPLSPAKRFSSTVIRPHAALMHNNDYDITPSHSERAYRIIFTKQHVKHSAAACPVCACLRVSPIPLVLGKNQRSEEHTSELQSRPHLVCRLLLEKKKKKLKN